MFVLLLFCLPIVLGTEIDGDHSFVYATKNFPNPAPEVERNSFKLNAPNDERIILRCESWKIQEGDRNCDGVNLIIKDGGSHKEFCGDAICKDINFESKTNKIRVWFRVKPGSTVKWVAKILKNENSDESSSSSSSSSSSEENSKELEGNDKGFIRHKLIPGKSIVITNPGYRQPESGPGDLKHTFIGKKGYEILASCDDEYRPVVNYYDPCSTLTVTFDDGANRKRFCSAQWTNEVFFITKKTRLNFQMNFTYSPIIRCVFRTTEPSKPTKILTVSSPIKIHSPNRSSFSEDTFLIRGKNKKPFNIDCQFKDTENPHCILSRVVMTVDNEEIFCISREYRRSNIKKAVLRVFSDGNGWPEIYCDFNMGTPSKPDTPRAPKYFKRPRKNAITRKESVKEVFLKGGEHKEIIARKDAQNVLIMNVQVHQKFKIYVYCEEYKPEIDSTLPCDTFQLTIEESGRIPEYWCSKRHAISLAYLSSGPKLKLTMENYSKNNKVVCVARSTEPPKPTQIMSLHWAAQSGKISLPDDARTPEYMYMRWIFKHPTGGKLTTICNIPMKENAFCLQRGVAINSELKCDGKPFKAVSYGQVDIGILGDEEGFGGRLCDVYGEF